VNCMCNTNQYVNVDIFITFVAFTAAVRFSSQPNSPINDAKQQTEQILQMLYKNKDPRRRTTKHTK
jgi:hypothetical protein